MTFGRINSAFQQHACAGRKLLRQGAQSELNERGATIPDEGKRRWEIKNAASGVTMVGVERFELPTLWSQTRCATRLRYTPCQRRRRYTLRPWAATSISSPSTLTKSWLRSTRDPSLAEMSRNGTKVSVCHSSLVIAKSIAARAKWCTTAPRQPPEPARALSHDRPTRSRNRSAAS